MLHSKIKQWTTCDRCGEVIDDFKLITVPWKHRFQVSASSHEYRKEGYFIPDSLNPLPGTDVVQIEGIIGYRADIKTLHLCDKCGKEFKRFMKNEN